MRRQLATMMAAFASTMLTFASFQTMGDIIYMPGDRAGADSFTISGLLLMLGISNLLLLQASAELSDKHAES